ncbi:extracellular mutant protein 11-domain-containing protein [Dendryphion nanum]|uniref:Extracellular mutant protein 11-domain-containing protein n=1 Tax=Dendryphion nanum TaxID=256645 RepID=A0A9P9DLV9_9PLEO|nr:extracellular mutant protein 11-domain-containing protein [Dendryphion nanum]
MLNFVRQPDMANNVQNGQPSNVRSTRALAGAQAKVTAADMNRHKTKKIQHNEAILGQRETQSARRPYQRSISQDQDPSFQREQNAWETDAESIDTTVKLESILQVEDSQRTHHGLAESDFEEQHEEGENEEREDEHDLEAINSVEIPSDQEFIDQYELKNLPTPERQRVVAGYRERYESGVQEPEHGDMFGANDSYPSTTSGRPDDDPQSAVGISEFGMDGYEEREGITAPTQFQTVNNPISASSRNITRGPVPVLATRTIQQPVNYYKQGATIRATRPTAPTLGSSSGAPNRNIKVQPSQHHRTHYTDNNVPHFPHETNEMHRNTPPGTDQALPKRVVHPSVHRAPRITETEHVPKVATNFAISPAVHTGLQLSQDKVDQVLDYEDKELFGMSYEQLKNEDFDTDPRAEEPRLTEKMRQKPLEERLQHVQKNIDPNHHAEFFTTLPTKEWEDAGDWFLDRFSDIIKRAKDARQHKRKLAQDFEDEVEKRHIHVSKKRHIVETALGGMKSKGQDLIPTPRTPRASKSPAPSKTK